MAMTKNIRTTVNVISKLFALTNETYKRMTDMKNAKTAKESIECSKALNNYSKRVDRLCAKLGFERDAVDEVFAMSGGLEDQFVLDLLSFRDYAHYAYKACIASETVEGAEFLPNDEPAEGYPDAPYIAPAE